jgi:shikimate dehydrogenase
MKDILELGLSGWLRNGLPWEASRPFYGVLGDPIAHSLSPAMHNAALAERELDHEYVPIRLEPEQVQRLHEWSDCGGLAGFNVTAPLKEIVTGVCDDLTDPARTLGAVNTVKVENGTWKGHNTDSGGILTVLTEAWTADKPALKATVLGTGGSARAAVDALARWGAESITVQAHSAEGLERFENWVRAHGDYQQVTVESLPQDAVPAPDQPEVWLCCLKGSVDARAYLPDAAGTDPALLMDLRYGSQLPDGQAPLGFQFADGLPVLLMQGVLSFAWWFGPPIPIRIMQSALP